MAAKTLGHGRGAEALAQLLDPPRAHLGRRDLRVDVAAHQRGLPAVGENDALDIGLRAPGGHDLDRRQQQALLEHLGRVRRGRAGDRTADVSLVRDRAGKRRRSSPSAKTGATNAMSETCGSPPS